MKLDHVRTLKELRIYPYYRDIAIEVPPVFVGGIAEYSTSISLGQSCEILKLVDGTPLEPFHLGATYFGVGEDATGSSIQTHWMFCTKAGATPAFGIAVNPAVQGLEVPLALGIEEPLIKLEELADFRAVHNFPPFALGIAEMQLGTTGWLVSTRIGAPQRIGFLIDDPTMPPSLAPGARNIAISAKSIRTSQTIGCTALEFTHADQKTLFLQRAS